MSQIPRSLQLLNASEVSNVVISRENTTIYPTGGQDYPSGVNGGGVIEFKVPVSSNKSIDMSSFFIHFNAQITNKANPSFVYFEDSIESVIDEVTIYVGNGGQEIERIRGYNRLESALNYYVNNGYINSFGGSAMAAGLSVEERKSLWTGSYTGTEASIVQCSMPLKLSGVCNPSFIMPSAVFGQSNFLIIRIRLNRPSACLQSYTVSEITQAAGGALGGGVRSAVTTAQYTLSNVRASFDFIQTTQDYQNQINQFLASNNLVYPVKTWDVDFRAIPSGQTTFVENLSYNYRDVEAIFFWFNLQTELGNFIHHGEDRLHVPALGTASPNQPGAVELGNEVISSLQLTINGSKVPAQPIDLRFGASEAFAHLLSALGVLHTSEQMGPFNFEKLQSIVMTSSAGNADCRILSCSTTSNRYYGRNKRVATSNDITLSNGNISTSNIKLDVTTSAISEVNSNAPEINPYLTDTTPSYFLIGINLRKLLDLPEGQLSGLNLNSTSGSIGYDLRFTQSTTNAYSMGVAVLHNRFISLSGAGTVVDI